MKNYQSIIYIVLAMFAFGLMALFTREANADILTIATWRAILVAVLFGFGAAYQKELRFFEKKDKDEIAPIANGVETESSVEETVNKEVEGFKDLSSRGLLSTSHLQISIPYGLFLGMASSTFVGGYALSTIANTIFLHNLAVLFTIPLVYWKLSERTSSNIILGGLISLVGVGFISGVSIFHASHFTNPRFLIGDIMAVLSAVGYAGVLVWTQICRMHKLPIMGRLFIACTTAALTLITITLVGGTFAISISSFWWILGLAFFSTFLPFILLSQGMKNVAAGLASLLSMTEVLFATLLGILIYNETLAPIGWLGGLLITIGVLYPLLVSSEENENSSVDVEFPKSKEWQSIRNIRVGFWLLALNISAYIGILENSLFISVAVLLVLFHISQPTVAGLLDYKHKTIQHGVFTLFGISLLVLLWIDTSTNISGNSVLCSLLLLSFLIDYSMTQRERSTTELVDVYQNEGNPSFYLLLLTVGTISEVAGHRFYVIGYPLFSLVGSIVVIEQCLKMWGFSSQFSKIQLPQSPKWYFILGILGFAIGGIYIVPPGHQGLIERFGVRQGIQESGLLLRVPPPIEEVHIIDVQKVSSVDIFPISETILCADQSMISLEAVVEYTILELSNYEYQSMRPVEVVRKTARKTIVDQSRQTSYEQIFQNRGELSQKWKLLIQNELNQLQLGINIEQLHLVQVTIPVAVKDSFLDVVSAKEDQSTYINAAEADAAAAIPLALGEAVVIHESAVSIQLQMLQEADSWSKLQQARMKEDVEDTNDNLYLDWIGQSWYTPQNIKNPIIKNLKGNAMEIHLSKSKEKSSDQ